MRIALVLEKKSDYPFGPDDPPDLDSELFSDEEEDALLSGLRDAGHEVVRVGDGRSLVRRAGYWRKRCDLAFNLSVGYRGIDRKSHVPGVLELAGIPYIGSDAYALSLTRHKFHAKLIVAAAGVQTAPAVLWENDAGSAALSALPYPAIVKPVAESSSIGIVAGKSIVETPDEAAAQARWVVANFRQPALVEMFVRGTEVEVPLLGGPDLAAVGVVGMTIGGQVVRGDVHLVSESVYSDEYGFVTDLPGLDVAAVERAALVAASALGIRDYGRIDFRVAEDGTPYFMEASTHPHLQPHSSFFALAQRRGIDYASMLDEIVAVGAARLHLSV